MVTAQWQLNERLEKSSVIFCPLQIMNLMLYGAKIFFTYKPLWTSARVWHVPINTSTPIPTSVTYTVINTPVTILTRPTFNHEMEFFFCYKLFITQFNCARRSYWKDTFQNLKYESPLQLYNIQLKILAQCKAKFNSMKSCDYNSLQLQYMNLFI
jgi:hypothetical protein